MLSLSLSTSLSDSRSDKEVEHIELIRPSKDLSIWLDEAEVCSRRAGRVRSPVNISHLTAGQIFLPDPPLRDSRGG